MIVGIIPKWGRTSRYVLKRLGEIAGQDLGNIIDIIKSSKEYLTENPDEAESFLQSLREQGFNCFSLSSDRKRETHPDRIGLRRLDLVIDGINVRIEGDEPHNGSSLIRLDEADFTFAGLDELLIHNQQWMYDKGRKVRTWGNHNYQLQEPTDVKVAGSAGIISSNGLQDFIGMFLIGNPQKRPVKNIDPQVLNGTIPLFVKGRYEGIVLNAYPNAKTMAVENVEDKVVSTPNSYGVELIQTGSTAKEKGLIVYGSPLFLSETLLVVNYGHFQKNEELRRVVEKLQPQGFYDEQRVDNFVNWYVVLQQNLGENWANRPPFIDEVFVTYDEIEAGVRPYTTMSRDWKASDRLPTEMRAKELRVIRQRKNQLTERYLRHMYQRDSMQEKTGLNFQEVAPILTAGMNMLKTAH